MSELKDEIRRAIDRHDPPQDWLERIHGQAQTRRRNRRIVAGAAGLGFSLILIVALMAGLRTSGRSRPGSGVTTPSCGSGTTVAPTGWWRADGSPANAAGGRDAVLHGDVSFGPGVAGEAFLLDGESGYVEAPGDAAFGVGSGDFTVALWVDFRSTAGEQVLAEDWVGKGATSEGWTLTKLDSDAIGFAVSTAGSVETEPLDLPVGTWIHVAARREAGTLSIFVNGELATSGSIREPQASADSAASLKFGHRGTSEDTPGSLNNQGFFVQGELDEIELFVGRALSKAQIRGIFDTQSSCAV